MEKKINEIIIKAEELSKKISLFQNEKSIPVIDMDIILMDIRTLYEKAKALQSTSPIDIPEVKDPTIKAPPVQATPEKTPSVQESSAQDPQVQTPSAQDQPVQAPQENNPPVPNQIVDSVPSETPKQETASLEAPSIEAPSMDTPPVNVPPADTVSNKEDQQKSGGTTILADKYKSEKKYINESLAGNLERNDVSSKIQSKPIQNISSALGINDRFQLINDLFNGDKDSFQNTLSALDESANFNEAFNYITSTFDWDMEEDSVQLLLDLVRRKFIVNKDE